MYPVVGMLSTNLCSNEWAYQRGAPKCACSVALHLVVKMEAMEDRRLRKGTLSTDIGFRLKYLEEYNLCPEQRSGAC